MSTTETPALADPAVTAGRDKFATVDRLLHHAHLVLTKGDSHRLAEALAGKGVIPLTT